MSSRRGFLAGASGILLSAGIRGQEGQPSGGLVLGQTQGAEAGREILRGGGNAVDAIAAAALAAGVAAPASTGVAGYGGAFVVAQPDGTVSAIDFNGTAPRLARPELFTGKSPGQGSPAYHGWLSPCVPGVLAGIQMALDQFGTRKFSDVAQPAIRLARDGFTLNQQLANAIRNAAASLGRDPGSAALYLPGGKLPVPGARLFNKNLAKMLEILALKGRVDDFYQGQIADSIAEDFRKNDGLVRKEDLASFRAQLIKPLEFTFGNWRIYTPPPTAGGITALQALAIVQRLGDACGVGGSASWHQARLESLRLAWGDRLSLLGDDGLAEKWCRELLSPGRTENAAEKVKKAVKNSKPVTARTDGSTAGGTIHLSAVDREGRMASLTFTHGDGFGSHVTIDRWGLTLGHGMSRFNLQSGHPNSIGPGKRPLHNMCPVVAVRGRTPVLAMGATGGRKIPNALFDVLSHLVLAGNDHKKAVAAPRMNTDGGMVLSLEKSWHEGQVAAWKALGYETRVAGSAALNMVYRGETGQMEGLSR